MAETSKIKLTDATWNPIDGEVRFNPAANHTAMRRVGKTAAGRLLDGVTHDEVLE